MPGDKWNKTCFTIFDMSWNPQKVVDHLTDKELYYILCQKEQCPTTNKLHWQGYYECKTRKGIKGHQNNLLAPKCHVEQSYGSYKDNKIYCSKDNTSLGERFEWGEPIKQGERRDLSLLKKDLDAGMSLKEIAENHFQEFLLYNNGIKEYMLLNRPKRSWKTELHVIVGPAGCGKSEKVWSHGIDKVCTIAATQTGVWWDVYDGEEIILFDEFCGQIPYSTLLNLTDRYPFTVPKKRSTVQFTGKLIYIVSNKTPDQWYPEISKDKNLWPAFLRRIDKYYNFYDKTVYEKPPDTIDTRIPFESLVPVNTLNINNNYMIDTFELDKS